MKKQKGILAWLSVYPDFGMDSEGYPVSPRKMPALLSGSAFLLLAALILRQKTVLSFCLGLGSFAVSGWYCFLNIFYNFRRGRFSCEAVPILLAALLGIASKKTAVSAALMISYQAVKYVEVTAIHRQQENAQKLLKMLPGTAVIQEGELRRTIKSAHIRQGDLLFVNVNEIVPIDGVVEDGMSSVDLSPLISARRIITVAPGSEVTGGCINLSVPLKVRAICDYSASTPQKIYASFTNVIRGESEDQKLTSKAGNLMIPAMILLVLFFTLLIPLVNGDWITACRSGMVFLLCACPYALNGSLTLAVFSAVLDVFVNGVVIRDIRVLGKLAKVETFICNKTCTITESAYSVREVCPAGISEERFLSLLARVESISEHPIAKAIRKYTGYPEETPDRNLQAEEIPCKGISAVIDGHTIFVGNASLLFENGVNSSVPEGQGTAIHLAVDQKYCGYVLLENPVREGNFEAIEQMRAAGVKNFVLLSGDLRSVVRTIASSLNFNVVKAELSPDGKKAAVDYLNSNKTSGKTLAYAGDGVNELRISSEADLSVTTSALGVEEASRADVVLLGEGIMKFPAAVRAGRAAGRLSFLSVFIHYAIRFLAIVLAFFGVCAPAVTGIVFAVCSIISYLFASVFFEKL